MHNCFSASTYKTIHSAIIKARQSLPLHTKEARGAWRICTTQNLVAVKDTHNKLNTIVFRFEKYAQTVQMIFHYAVGCGLMFSIDFPRLWTKVIREDSILFRLLLL
jgi:hypothetical protein